MKYDEINSEIKKELKREWIITNGIGGFASQSAIGVNTRKYSGLLVAPLTPPARRFVLLSKVDESIEIDEKKYDLFTNISNGYISEGFKYLVDFKKEYLPIYTYKVENVVIKKIICMKYGENTVTILYKIKNQNSNTHLTLAPLVNFRDFHAVSNNHIFNVNQTHNGTKLKLIIDGHSETPIYINCSDGKYFKHNNDMFINMRYPEEEERGFPSQENHAVPGVYDITINPSEEKDITFVCSMNENIEEIDAVNVINKEIMRLSDISYDSDLLNDEKNDDKRKMIQDFIIASDNFVVNRPAFGLHTLIAGYPWFLDWGRDSLISFEGLLLLTKRFDIAREVLLTNIKDVKYGFVPNGYSGYDNRPLYNSADSSLLLFEQIYKYLKYTNDYDFVKEKMYSTMQKIIYAYSSKVNIDENNIYLDKDNLLSAGTESTQITWMDVKIMDKAITPRNGKTVELNALWYNALKIMEEITEEFCGKTESKKYHELAENTKAAFNKKFYNLKKKCLYDVLGDDKIRPNQLFALSLSYPVVDPSSQEADNILSVVKSKLLNDYGLKTLAKGEENYVEIYEGNSLKRDSSYHQGITWPWLLGLYFDSLKNVLEATKEKEKKEIIKKELIEFRNNVEKKFYKEMTQRSTVGSISELYDSAKPYKARGAFAQAWSVAEVFRIIMWKE